MKLLLAVKDVKAGGSIRGTARKYGLCSSTLCLRLKKPNRPYKPGPAPFLSEEEECCLEDWIIDVIKRGFPLKNEDLQASVQKILTDNPRPTSFKDNCPGRKWILKFLRRHPAIGKVTPDPPSGFLYAGAHITESDIRKWFSDFYHYLNENDLLDALSNPSRLYIGDEGKFRFCSETGKVIALKDVKYVNYVETLSWATGGQTKLRLCPKTGRAKKGTKYADGRRPIRESTAVMFTFAASGEACSPMLIYSNQDDIEIDVPPCWSTGRSDNGFMTADLFLEYIAQIFHPYLISKNVKLPVIYFVDGYKTHLSYEVCKLCKELQIELVALYPNAHRIFKPAEAVVSFRPDKEACDLILKAHSNSKEQIAEILNVAFQNCIETQTLINGFEACGLFPFDPNVVQYEKCINRPIKKKISRLTA